MRNTYLCFASFVVLMPLSFSTAQIDTAWCKQYNGPGNLRDEARAIAVERRGNVYVYSLAAGGFVDVKKFVLVT